MTALSDVVKTCTAALKSEDSTVKPAEIVKCCLREARKESLGYKVGAVSFKIIPLLKSIKNFLRSFTKIHILLYRFVDLYLWPVPVFFLKLGDNVKTCDGIGVVERI